jgi:hypothetical protein
MLRRKISEGSSVSLLKHVILSAAKDLINSFVKSNEILRCAQDDNCDKY